jgi:heptosyltransferase-2
LPERFAEAAVRVARETDSTVRVFGTAQEQEICAQVASMVGGSGVEVANTAGKTTLAQFIDQVAECEVMITNDSGSMHVASALGVPTVAIFGATNDVTTGPTGPRSRVVREPVECSPCLLRECPIDHRCMTRVPAGRVAETALELLK